MTTHSPLTITTITSIMVVTLGIMGWLIYVDVTFTEAKAAYESSLGQLVAAQDDAKTAEEALESGADSLSGHITIADELITLLGDGTDILTAAGAATSDARGLLHGAVDTAPRKSAGELPESPAIEHFDTVRRAVDSLTKSVTAYIESVLVTTESRTSASDTLRDAWLAQAAIAPETAAASVAANPNASQASKDAATAVGEAIAALTDPLDVTAPDLWRALHASAATLASEGQ